MRLFLAVAVLMLALVAYTEAQTDETVEQKFTKFGNQMAEMGQTLAEKAKSTLDDISNSEFAETTKNWFQRQFETVKAKLGEISQ